MKRASKFLLGITLLTLCFFNSALAVELGFKAGLAAVYTGEFEDIHTNYEEVEFNVPLESIGMPLSVFLLYNNIKMSYLHYEQYADKDFKNSYVNGQRIERDKGAILVRNDVFTIGYQREWLLPWYELQAYGTLDVALFKSLLNIELSTYDGGIKDQGLRSSGVSSTMKSEPEISLGLVFGGGVKKYIENVFVTADVIYINKKIHFERIATYEEQVRVDISGFIFSIGTGVAF